jgi:hypothetical protein
MKTGPNNYLAERLNGSSRTGHGTLSGGLRGPERPAPSADPHEPGPRTAASARATSKPQPVSQAAGRSVDRTFVRKSSGGRDPQAVRRRRGDRQASNGCRPRRCQTRAAGDDFAGGTGSCPGPYRRRVRPTGVARTTAGGGGVIVGLLTGVDRGADGDGPWPLTAAGRCDGPAMRKGEASWRVQKDDSGFERPSRRELTTVDPGVIVGLRAGMDRGHCRRSWPPQ